MKSLLILSFSVFAFAALPSCKENKGPAEKVGDKIDDATDSRPGEKIRDAVEDVKK